MTKTEHITIAGAGLVGSLLAVLLGKRGYKVTVLERRGDMRGQDVDSGRSINLAMSERGLFAMQQAGLLEEVHKLLIPMTGRMLHLDDGAESLSPYGQRPDEKIYSVSRGLLNSLMMTTAEKSKNVSIEFETSVESVDFENKEITISRDGVEEIRSYDVLFGADGAGSRVRKSLIPVINGDFESEFLDHDYKELEIPAADDGTHRLHREALHIWPRGGYMVIALPNLDGSFTVTLFLAKKGEPSFEQLVDAEAVRSFFAENFPSAMELMPHLATDFFDNPQGLLGTVRCTTWNYKDSALILGDASHAIVPFHGQGMNAGFEDCTLLISMLDKAGGDWSAVIPSFGDVRWPDAHAIAEMALENYVTMRDSVLDPKFHLKKEVGFQLELEFPNRFIPRYSMVMFHNIPYSEAYRRGIIQDEILDRLVADCDTSDQVDRELAEALILERLSEIDPTHRGSTEL